MQKSQDITNININRVTGVGPDHASGTYDRFALLDARCAIEYVPSMYLGCTLYLVLFSRGSASCSQETVLYIQGTSGMLEAASAPSSWSVKMKRDFESTSIRR